MAANPANERTITLSDAVRAKIDKDLTKYPADQKQSAIKGALMYVQKENGGWLTEPLINAVADYLEMPRIAAFEVATFYTMYDLEAVGKHKVNVCTNISCLLRGSGDVVKHLETRTGAKCGSTSSDGRYTLREVECMGACAGAPMMEIDEIYYENLTPESIDDILSNLERAGSGNAESKGD